MRLWPAVAAILTTILLIGTSGPQTRTVPSAVLYDGHAANLSRIERVKGWALSELEHIAARFDLPRLTLTVVPAYSWNGITVIAQEPAQYTVVLVAWAYPDEGEVRRVASHEAAHVLLDMAGMPNTEANADLFAACFGSRGNPKGEGCQTLAESLQH